LNLSVPARAKLNLDFEVLGRRPDGYHEIRTTMQAIELCDVLVVDTADETELSLSGQFSVPHDDNSVLKAHQALERATRRKLPASFHLHKQIPPGSGMGGASSDAGATLQCLKALYRLKVDLQPIAAEIGSDVPFFLSDGSAVVEGRGEKVRAVPARQSWYAIAWPRIELSTRAVYDAWDKVNGHGLQQAAEHVEPRLKQFANRLGSGWRMTGSGSAFFKAAESEQEARAAIVGLDSWTVVTRAFGRWA
jgi:4-diphosphocytidyl-2-C-methyl-D-erythritol kinase